MNNIESRFYNLLAGREDAWGTIDGKSIRETLEHKHIKNHLFGHESLGTYPLLDNGTCKFAVVDFDFKTDSDRCIHALMEARKFNSKLIELGINSAWFERSKSGMIHLWILFSDFIEASKIRRILFYVANELGLEVRDGIVEIFPKEDNLEDGRDGNYVHLPYFRTLNGQCSQYRTMINPFNLKQIGIKEFLRKAEKSLITPDMLDVVYEKTFKDESNHNEKRYNDNEISQSTTAKNSTLEQAKEVETTVGYGGNDQQESTKCSQSNGQTKALTVNDILSVKVDHSLFLVDNILKKGGITVCSGYPGSGKTYFSLEITRCISSGEKLFGILDTRQGTVSYFDQENSIEVLQNRINQMNFPNQNILFHHDRNFNIENNFDRIRDIAKESDVLIFDSFIQFHHRNENKAVDIKIPMQKLRQLANKYHCAILLIHQNRKPGQFESNELFSARGSMQIIYDADMAFSLRRVKDGGRVLECTKSRLIEEPKPIKFDIESDENGKVKLVYLGQYDEFISKKERAKFRIPSILESATEPLPNEEIHKKLAESGISIGLSTLKPMLKELENNKIINSKTEQRGKKYYFLKNIDSSES